MKCSSDGKTFPVSIKYISVFLAFIFVLLSFTACSGETKTIYSLLADEQPDNALLMIVNNPKEDVISKVEITKSLTLTDEGDRFLVIPKYKNSILEIWSIETDGSETVKKDRVYFNGATEENLVLDINALRSDDAPAFEIVIRTPKYYSNYTLYAIQGDGSKSTYEYAVGENASFGKEDVFSFDEIAYLFYQGNKYLRSVYGNASDTHTIEKNGTGTATRLFFNSTIFEIDNKDSLIYHAIMMDDKLPHIRGVKIGDSLPMVLVKFPNENDGYTEVFDESVSEEGENIREGVSYTYQLLYGEFGVGQYGYIKYDSREVVTDVIYVDNGKSVIFSFKNNRVLSIEYRTEA